MMPAMASLIISFFFFNDTATTEIYTLSLHDALPISSVAPVEQALGRVPGVIRAAANQATETVTVDYIPGAATARSEEHTSELQSRLHLVCRLLLEKKKKIRTQ